MLRPLDTECRKPQVGARCQRTPNVCKCAYYTPAASASCAINAVRAHSVHSARRQISFTCLCVSQETKGGCTAPAWSNMRRRVSILSQANANESKQWHAVAAHLSIVAHHYAAHIGNKILSRIGACCWRSALVVAHIRQNQGASDCLQSTHTVCRFSLQLFPLSSFSSPTKDRTGLRVVPSRNWKTSNPEPRSWSGFETLFCFMPNPAAGKWCDDVTKSSHLYQVPGKSSHFWKY